MIRLWKRLANWWRDLLHRIRKWIQWLLDWLARNSGGGGSISDDKCCHLARLDRECNWFGSKQNFTCPEGYHRHWWYCCEGSQQIACGECTQSTSSCWQGPWECSIWWYTGQAC